MKKLIITLLFFAVFMPVISAFVHGTAGGTIKGTIYPADAAVKVKAVNANVLDSTVVLVKKGSFEIPGLKEGNYTVDIIGLPPYKTISKMNIKVAEGQTTDIGEIKLTGESE